MKPITYGNMVIKLLEHQLSCRGDILNNTMDTVFYLKDAGDNYHKISEVDLYSNKIKCIDGSYDYNEYVIGYEGIQDMLFEEQLIRF